jgi:DNA repair ATPase RecN
MEFMGGQLSSIAQANLALAQRMDAHEESLRQTCQALGTVSHLVQSLDAVCDNTDALTQQVQDANAISERIAQQMPSQVSFQKELNRSLARIDSLKTVVQTLQTSIAGVRQDLRKHV